ncbi:MAG: hypothetical protein HYZ27_02625, partial [Deltaproteobacteria bacterium]|nr:hypothetical protein [Deltaproteobacteria bacterium]
MSQVLRIFGIIVVFGMTSVAWLILGGVTTSRTSSQASGLADDVAELWGREQQQRAPSFTVHWKTYETQERTETVDGKVKIVRSRQTLHHSKEVFPAASTLSVNLGLDQRLKGLVWYSLSDVTLHGEWIYEHREPFAGELQVNFAFPDAAGLYDDFSLLVDEVDYARSARPQE